MDDVEVVSYMFGYRNKKSSYFVSEWREELKIPMSVYLSRLSTMDDDEAWDRFRILNKRVFELMHILEKEYADFNHDNMAYDEKNDKIILYDLITTQDFDDNRSVPRRVV